MIIKKIWIVFSLIVFFAAFSFAITNDVFDNQEYKKDEKSNYYKYLKYAKKYYLEGNFNKAEIYIDKVFEISLDNDKANELRNKILLLKEKENYYKKYLVNDLIIELRRAVKEGNCYEGFLFVKKIQELSPDKNLDTFISKLNNEKEMLLYSIENSMDKKFFLKSLDLFVREKFRESIKYLDKLYVKYPKFYDYIGLNRCYVLQETTNKRVKELYVQAIKNLKQTRLGIAKDYAEMAYDLQYDNIKLKLLLDQINMEML